MSRIIKASEVKPGMRVRFEMDGWHVEGTISRVEPVTFGLEFYSTQSVEMTLGEDTPVTVLSEPAPVQPEEPLWIAARAKVGDRRFFRVDESDRPWRKADCMGRISPYQYSWTAVCSLGPVTVVPDQGWTFPEDTPEVPERIKRWPEDDEALRGYKWRDRDGDIWEARGNQWICNLVTYAPVTRPSYGPWTRVTDA